MTAIRWCRRRGSLPRSVTNPGFAFCAISAKPVPRLSPGRRHGPGARVFPRLAHRFREQRVRGNPLMYTLGAAARAAGKSKATISRAIKAGRLSAGRSDGGGYAIDPAELHRVYPATGGVNPTMKRSDTVDGPGAPPSPETVALHRLLAEREETIRDLRARLDTEVAERHREAEERRRLMAMLTDQRTRPWWRRWFR